MIVKLLAEHHLEFLSLKGGCRRRSESTLVKMAHCWKSHVTTHIYGIFLTGASKLLGQISENERERLFELERKDQENVQMQRYVEKMMADDRVSLEKKKAEQAALRVGYIIHKSFL